MIQRSKYSVSRLQARSVLSLACAVLLGASAHASDCFDHWNHRSWDGDGVSMVLCRNNSNRDLNTFIEACEIRHAGGAKIRDLDRHGNLDDGRVIYTDRTHNGNHYDFDVDIVCRSRAGVTYTFSIGNGNSWEDGCCRNRECGSTACCGTDCSGSSSSSDAGGIVVQHDAGGPSGEAQCDQVRSREYNQSAVLLDVTVGSTTKLSFHLDGLPSTSGLVFGRLSLRLHDADHPGQEGTVFINGQGPLSLPADPSWDDQTVDTTLAVPIGYLTSGENLVQFGAGPRDRTYYSVEKVAIDLFGPQCAPAPDTRRPDAAMPDTLRPDTALPDAAVPDSVRPDGMAPDSEPPDTGLADLLASDVVASDVAVRGDVVREEPYDEADASTDHVAFTGCSCQGREPANLWAAALAFAALVLCRRRHKSTR